MIHEDTAKEMSLHVGKRVEIKNPDNNKKIISIVDIVTEIIKPKEIAVSLDTFDLIGLKNKEIVNVTITNPPKSIALIKRKLKGERLDKQEIEEIVNDIADNALTEVEVSFFVSAVYTKGMSLEETENLTDAMVKSGNRMHLPGKVIDKHCIGGIAGNRTTPIIVAILAAKGLTVPKTSSRAITSAAGTADVIESIARVEFSIKEIKKIIHKTNACLVWGGALGLAPVDDKIIRIENIVNIDSTAQLLASILSKKISVGSKYVLIDIPCGRSAKVSRNQALKLKEKFMYLGKKFGLKITVVLTDGTEPIGNGVGPLLEIKDILKILRREDGPKDLEDKSIALAGILFELSGEAKKGEGASMARGILESGEAYKKFVEIIHAQKGSINNLKEPKLSFDIHTEKDMHIHHLNNKLINKLAREAGCPEDKLAGLYIYKKKGDFVHKGDAVMTVYATSKEKLNYAKKFYRENKKFIFV